jgi:3-deoxy-D-manno-octulosonic-acid transferase
VAATIPAVQSRIRLPRLYNILFLIFFALSSPYYFWRLRRRGDWRGLRRAVCDLRSVLKQALTNRHVIWLHAVSVGEVNLCTQLIRALEPRLPNLKIVVSCTTTTGMAELRRRLPTHISKIYYPIDRRKYVAARWPFDPGGHRAGGGGNLAEFSLARARFENPGCSWPTRGCPTARIRGYKKFGWLFRPLFASFAGVGCQNEEDAQRLRDVGCRPETVQVVGNLKFDAARLDRAAPARRARAAAADRRADDALILVGGSTHDGEEACWRKWRRGCGKNFRNCFSCSCRAISSAATTSARS